MAHGSTSRERLRRALALALVVAAGASSALAGESTAASSGSDDDALGSGPAWPGDGGQGAPGGRFDLAPPRVAWTGETAAFGLGLAAFLGLDQRIREGVQERRTPSLDRWQLRVEPLGSIELTSLGALALWEGGRLAGSGREAENGRILAEALLLANTLDLGTRWVLGRRNPGVPGEPGGFFSDGHHSFPSGHATRAFAVATVLSERYGRGAGFVAYPLAAILGLSRIEADAHWSSDVFAGAVLGHVVAEYVCRRTGSRSREERAVHVVPGVSSGRRPAAGLFLDVRVGPR